jgi:hypothetical protein
MSDHKNSLPQPSGWDHLHVSVKAAISAIPIAGSPAAEIFAAIIAPPLARRRDEWLQSLADGLDELEQKVEGFKAETLSQREDFVSAALQASHAAIRTHQPEKLEALRNAVLNIAAGRSPGEDEEAIFLRHIDSLTTWHLRILKFLESPLQLVRERRGRTDYALAGSLSQPLEEVFPELRGRRDFYDQIMRDLRTCGFLNSDETVLHTTMTAAGIFAKRTTPIADRFLAFIASPL